MQYIQFIFYQILQLIIPVFVSRTAALDRVAAERIDHQRWIEHLALCVCVCVCVCVLATEHIYTSAFVCVRC